MAVSPRSLVPVALGAAHLVVDAATVATVFRTGLLHALVDDRAFALVFGYDFIAFGTQPFWGWLLDRFPRPKLATVVGLVGALAGLLLVPAAPWIAMLVAGLANALFHLGAGKRVLDLGLDRAAAVGVFVAPGAIGLAFGLLYGPTSHPLWPLVIVVAAVIAASFAWRPSGVQQVAAVTRPEPLPRGLWVPLLLLSVSIAIRSFVGMSALRGCTPSTILLVGVPAAAFAGKAFGGLVADRIGWLEAPLVALVLSIPLLVWGAHTTPLLLAGLALFQMTMPVTLIAIARLMPAHRATAFGATCLALFVGALPSFFRWGDALATRGALAGWICLAALCLAAGLVTMGISWRTSSPLSLTSH